MKKLLIAVSVFLCAVVVVLAQTARHYKHKSQHPFDVTISLNENTFRQKVEAGPPVWMREQISADLSAYKTGISKTMLDQLFRGSAVQGMNLVRFTVSQNKLSFSIDETKLNSRHFRHVLEAVKKLHQLAPLPDVDFILSLQDSIDQDIGAPLFVFAKHDRAKTLVLIPDFKALTGYPSLREEISRGGQKFPWEHKVARAFWRGATTGGWLTAKTWEQIPRCKLALLSLVHPQLLDAKVNGIVQCDPEVPALVQAKGILGRTVSQADHLKYKYLVDVDGNSCSFERLFWALYSNSVVLKQVTPNIQWYYGALRPYEHYIPVQEDLSDLITQCQWALDHDAEARQIAHNATEFIEQNLAVEDVFLYLHTLLTEYSKLQKGV